MNTDTELGSNFLEILELPRWKSKVLNTVAWLLGMRGEKVYCITLNVDLEEMRKK